MSKIKLKIYDVTFRLTRNFLTIHIITHHPYTNFNRCSCTNQQFVWFCLYQHSLTWIFHMSQIILPPRFCRLNFIEKLVTTTQQHYRKTIILFQYGKSHKIVITWHTKNSYPMINQTLILVVLDEGNNVEDE